MAKPRQYPGQKLIKKLLPKAAARHIDRRIRLLLCDAVVISYPKSGRTWLRAMLTLYFSKIYGTPKDVLFDFANLHAFDRRVPKVYFSHEADYKGAPESIRIDRRQLERKKLLFLARDPRDVIVSLYAHRVNRDRNWDGPIETFIASSDGGFTTALRYYKRWNDFLTSHHDAMVLRYEDLHSDPAAAFTAVLRHLGLPVDGTALRETIEESQFTRLQKMESDAHFRSKRLSGAHLNDPQAFKVRRGLVGGFAEDLAPGMAHTVGQMMDNELQGAFGYRAGPGK